MLWSQDHRQSFTRTAGVEPGFRRFRRIASTIMNHDGVAFVVLCLVTRDTLPVQWPPALRIALGALLILVGVGTKLWAAKTLGDGYYWHNFFRNVELVFPDPPGPYKYFKNPMYTVGNLHMYGLALVLGSWLGLLAAVFAQLALMGFHYVVEQPHFDRLRKGAPDPRIP